MISPGLVPVIASHSLRSNPQISSVERGVLRSIHANLSGAIRSDTPARQISLMASLLINTEIRVTSAQGPILNQTVAECGDRTDFSRLLITGSEEKIWLFWRMQTF